MPEEPRETWGGYRIPPKPILMQRTMLRVCYALAPLAAGAVYLFGWRALALLAVTLLAGCVTEALFTFRRGQPVTSAVFVTAMIFALSLPPTIPVWMAVVGIVAGVAIGKMAFGGFGHNVFNPAMVGRCFLYVTFPLQMTNTWTLPFWGGWGGLLHWAPSVDAITRATPLVVMRQGDRWPLGDLFLGPVPGSLGETSAVLILLGGAYILYRKAASWRLALGCVLGGFFMSSALHLGGVGSVAPAAYNLVSGSFLFGALFVVTEPISGAKTRLGQWIYSICIGALTIVLRGFSNFSAGIMFSVLIMNAFVPLLDEGVKRLQAARGRSR